MCDSRVKIIFLIVLAVCFILVGCNYERRLQFVSSLESGIECEKPEVDLGIVELSATPQPIKFILANTGQKPIQIMGLQISCKCADARVLEERILANSVGVVEVEIDKSSVGSFSALILVKTSISSHEPILLSINWIVSGGISASVRSVSFQDVVCGETATQIVDLSFVSDELRKYATKMTVSSRKMETVTCRLINDASQLVINVVPLSECSTRYDQTEVQVFGPDHKVILSIPVFWITERRLFIHPSSFVSFSAPTEKITRNVIVEFADERHLNLESISANWGSEVTFEKERRSESFDVYRIVLVPGSLKAMTTGYLTFNFRDASQPNVPVVEMQLAFTLAPNWVQETPPNSKLINRGFER